jgi:hypothetical protein
MMGIASKENVGESGMSTTKSGFKRVLGMSQKNSENVSSLLNRDTGKAITEKAGRQKAKSAAPAPAPKEANTEVKGIGVVKGGESGGWVFGGR